MDQTLYRYCQHCGARFDLGSPFCPVCVRQWQPSSLPADRATTKALLERLQDWYARGLLPAESFGTLRSDLEASFQVVDLPRDPTATASAGPDTAPARAAIPPSPPAGPNFGALVAERQADILLYLGAFLLGVAALIFVAYQDGTVSAAVRVPVLVGYTLASLVGGLLVRRWERVREAGHVFLALGALLFPLNFVLLYVDVLRDQDVPGDVVWSLASVACAAFYGGLAWRGLGSFYRVLAAGAAFSGWSSLISVFGIPAEWGGAWYMLLAVAVANLAAPRRMGIVIVAWGLGAFALAWAYIAILGDHHWQLPATNALATAGVAAFGYRLRWPWCTCLALFLGAASIASLLWVLDAPPATFAYPFVVSAALALAGTRYASRWPGLAGPGPWWYAGAMALAPLPTIESGRYDIWLGVALLGSAALFAYQAWKNTEYGLTATALDTEAQARPHTSWWERAFYAWAAAAFAMGAAATWQATAGIARPEAGWVFAVLAMLPALAVAIHPAGRGDRALILAIPVSGAAAIAALPPEGFPLYAAIFLAAPALAWFAAFACSGRWVTAVVGSVFATLAALGVRAEYDIPFAALALAYGAAGVALFAVLTPLRAYPVVGERATSVFLLSTGLYAAAIAVVVARLVAFQSDRLETGRELFGLIVDRGEYLALVPLVALAAPAIAYEGLRFRLRWMLLPATAIALAAGLLAIGLANPQNIQFYTVPTGAYLLAIGLILRRSPAFIPPHFQWHEIALLGGVLFVVLPQVEQSFEPGGATWGLVLIAEGLAFLAAGFVLLARWLVPAGTVVLSGVAIRWLLESSETVPYWITLGILGMLLLGGGMFVMLQAEWWNRVRGRASRWWQQSAADTPAPPEPLAGR